MGQVDYLELEAAVEEMGMVPGNRRAAAIAPTLSEGAGLASSRGTAAARPAGASAAALQYSGAGVALEGRTSSRQAAKSAAAAAAAAAAVLPVDLMEPAKQLRVKVGGQT
jgi:hypothetical protein